MRPCFAQELRLGVHGLGDVGPGRISTPWRSERSWVAQCRGAETNGPLIARRGRVAALVEGSSVKFKVRDGGLHVLRVGDGRPRMAFFLPRSSGQAGCDRLVFMLLRERHALNCRRPAPCGADGRVQVVHTVFFSALGGAESRRSPPRTPALHTIAFLLKDGPQPVTDFVTDTSDGPQPDVTVA